jgi:hypothetical protein
MKLIAHRGNIDGPDLSRENNPEYIEQAIAQEFDVEIDLRWKDHQFYLGHDAPQYHISISWLVQNKEVLWIHCKNREALEKMSLSPIQFNYFWHETDCYTLTSKGIGWVYPGEIPYNNSVIVMPEWKNSEWYMLEYDNCYGICSDYIGELNNV